MTNFKHGDTVRVVIEGTVAETQRGRDIAIGLYGSRNIINPDAEHVKSVELVKRRKPQVGDMIASRAALAELPRDSVVVNWYGAPLICFSNGTQGTGERRIPYRAGQDNGPYRVVYVPE